MTIESCHLLFASFFCVSIGHFEQKKIVKVAAVTPHFIVVAVGSTLSLNLGKAYHSPSNL